MPYDTTKAQWVYHHTYEDVLNYRASIARDRDRLKTYEPDSRDALSCLESIQMFEKWIQDAGYTVEPKASEAPMTYRPKTTQAEAAQPQQPAPNYTAYFRLHDGTTDAWDFHAANWMEANQEARRILNLEYRERVECEPYAVIRGKEMLVLYPRGKKPAGKRFADIIGLKLNDRGED